MAEFHPWEFDAPLLTEKQTLALVEATGEAERITGGETIGRWHISYEAETRPGRGHCIVAWAANGEYLATQYLDPYGRGSLVVAELNVIHNDYDEEHFDENGACECGDRNE